MKNFRCRVKPCLWPGVKTSQSPLTSVKALTVALSASKLAALLHFHKHYQMLLLLAVYFPLRFDSAVYGVLRDEFQVLQLFYDG